MSLDDIGLTLKCNQNILSMIYCVNCEEDDGKFITLLNKTISSSKCRLKGLELLNANIEKLPLNNVLENAHIWINVCIGHHQKHLKQIKMSIIGKIIETAYKDHDFTKKLLADYMPKILELCLSSQVNNYEMESALLTLDICMRRYGSWFGVHKSQIESLLLTILYCQYKNIIEIAGKAFVQLQQVGGAGVDGINHRNNFSSSFHKLCVTIHKLLDKFFEDETEIEQFDVSNEKDFLVPGVLSSSKLDQYIENCITFIKIMMMKGFSTIKDIKPIEVLNIIIRGMTFHVCLSGSKNCTLEKAKISVALNYIQIKLLELLKVLILWCQGNLLPFSYTISKVLIDCLSRSQQCKCFKINSNYRENVFITLNYWIRISQYAFHVNFQTKLIDCILEDIIPTKDEVKLIVNGHSNEIKTSTVANHNDSVRLNNIDAVEKENICCAALVTLKYLISNSWLRVNNKKLETLCGALLGTAQELITKKPVNPYTNITCQEKLFEVLVSFYEEATLSLIPNVNVALYILSKGRNSKNLKIVDACDRGINYLEGLCQPICPSLCGSQNSISIKSSSTEEFNVILHEAKESEIDSSKINDYDSVNGVREPLEFIDDNIIRSNEICVKNLKKDLSESDSVHIIDVQVLRKCNNEESGRNSLEIDSNFNQIENIDVNNKNEAINEGLITTSVDVQMEEYTQGNDSSEETSDQLPKQVGNDESEEPPNKMIKLEVNSETFDDFVDEVKEY